MRLRRLAIASFLLSAPCLACDDAQTCTLADCSNGGAITVETADDSPLPEAMIEITLELGVDTWSITCSPGEDGCEREGPQETPLDVVVWRGTPGVATGGTVEFSSGGRGDLPATYALRVNLGGDQVLEEAGTFEYETSAPNGPDCGPICDHAGILSSSPHGPSDV